MTSLTAAVAGTGFIGPVHVEGLKRAGVAVAGILGSTPEKSRAAAAQLGLPKGYASFEELLSDSAVDVVHLATPNRRHFEQASAALRSGKHVLCEKPLAMNSQETRALVQLAKECGRAAGVAYNIRFYPLCHEAAARAQRESFGEVTHVAGSYVQDWLLKPTDFNWRVLSKEGGPLRAVADIGTHWMDLVQFITGRKITAVLADLSTVHPVRQCPPAGSQETFTGKTAAPAKTTPVAINTEDCGNLLLKLDNGGTGCLWVSQVTAGRKNCVRFEISGRHDSLAWNSECPNELWIGHRDQPNELLLRDPALLSDSARAIAQYPGGHNEGFPDTFKQLFRTFYGAIETGKTREPSPYPTFEDGHREVLLCEAILQSHREHRWLTLPC